MKKISLFSDQSQKRQPETKNSRSRKHLHTLNNLNLTFEK
jgi:DNA-binding sugar fermentation-stimulating protein